MRDKVKPEKEVGRKTMEAREAEDKKEKALEYMLVRRAQYEQAEKRGRGISPNSSHPWDSKASKN